MNKAGKVFFFGLLETYEVPGPGIRSVPHLRQCWNPLCQAEYQSCYRDAADDPIAPQGELWKFFYFLNF